MNNFEHLNKFIDAIYRSDIDKNILYDSIETFLIDNKIKKYCFFEYNYNNEIVKKYKENGLSFKNQVIESCIKRRIINFEKLEKNINYGSVKNNKFIIFDDIFNRKLLLIIHVTKRNDSILEFIKKTVNMAILYYKEHSAFSSRKVIELSSLYELTKKVTIKSEVEHILEGILDILPSVIEYDTSNIFLKDKDQLVSVASRGIDDFKPGMVTVGINEDPIVSQVINENKGILITNVDRTSAQLPFQKSAQSFITVPFKTDDEILGTLNIASKGNKIYTEEDVKTLSVIASQTGIIFKSAKTLFELESHTKNILSSITTGVITIDTSMNTVIYNSAAQDILNISKTMNTEKISEQIRNILFNEPFNTYIDRALNKMEIIKNVEIEYLFNEGKSKILVLNISNLLDHKDDFRGVVVTFNDVTEQKRMEENLQRADKMSALGLLSAGVAHEIKNPLTAIRGFTQLLPVKYNNADFRQKFVEIITSEVNRLNMIVEELLSFSRPSAPERKLINIVDIIKRVLMLVNHNARKHNITIHTEFNPVDNIWIDSSQIEQVFINVILNAIDAIEREGNIYIRTYKKQNENKRQVGCSIRDDGIGISEEKLNKMFDPFYTTKDTGTGLGLSISQRIVQEHNGTINVRSKQGLGTEFNILLPVK